MVTVTPFGGAADGFFRNAIALSTRREPNASAPGALYARISHPLEVTINSKRLDESSPPSRLRRSPDCEDHPH